MSQHDKQKEQEEVYASLLSQAKRKGYIRASTILKKYEKYRLDDSEKDDLLESFEKEGVILVFSEDEPDDTAPVNEAEFDTSSFYIPEATDSSADSTVMDPLRQYLKEIHQFPSLSHKETLLLVRRVMEGDKEARNYLINCNLKLAYLVASKYDQKGIPILDLIQQANIGLMNAVDRYNPNRGTKFSSYAVFWIKQSIFLYIERQCRMIRLPKYVNEELKKIRQLQEKNYRTHQTYLSDDEVATALNLSIARVKYLNTVEPGVVSLDNKPNDDQENTFLELVKVEDESQDPYKEMKNSDLSTALNSFLEKLPERERLLLQMRYGLLNGIPMSLEEVGEQMNLSRERVRQLESQAFTRLRRMKSITSLFDYLSE